MVQGFVGALTLIPFLVILQVVIVIVAQIAGLICTRTMIAFLRVDTIVMRLAGTGSGMRNCVPARILRRSARTADSCADQGPGRRGLPLASCLSGVVDALIRCRISRGVPIIARRRASVAENFALALRMDVLICPIRPTGQGKYRACTVLRCTPRVGLPSGHSFLTQISVPFQTPVVPAEVPGAQV